MPVLKPTLSYLMYINTRYVCLYRSGLTRPSKAIKVRWYLCAHLRLRTGRSVTPRYARVQVPTDADSLQVNPYPHCSGHRFFHRYLCRRCCCCWNARRKRCIYVALASAFKVFSFSLLFADLYSSTFVRSGYTRLKRGARICPVPHW